MNESINDWFRKAIRTAATAEAVIEVLRQATYTKLVDDIFVQIAELPVSNPLQQYGYTGYSDLDHPPLTLLGNYDSLTGDLDVTGALLMRRFDSDNSDLDLLTLKKLYNLATDYDNYLNEMGAFIAQLQDIEGFMYLEQNKVEELSKLLISQGFEATPYLVAGEVSLASVYRLYCKITIGSSTYAAMFSYMTGSFEWFQIDSESKFLPISPLAIPSLPQWMASL